MRNCSFTTVSLANQGKFNCKKIIFQKQDNYLFKPFQ